MTTFSRSTINKLRRSGYLVGRDSKGVWVTSRYHKALTGERAYVVELKDGGSRVEFSVSDLARAGTTIKRFVGWMVALVGIMSVLVVAFRTLSRRYDSAETLVLSALLFGSAGVGYLVARRPSDAEVNKSRSTLRSAAEKIMRERPVDAADEVELPSTW